MRDERTVLERTIINNCHENAEVFLFFFFFFVIFLLFFIFISLLLHLRFILFHSIRAHNYCMYELRECRLWLYFFCLFCIRVFFLFCFVVFTAFSGTRKVDLFNNIAGSKSRVDIYL